MNEELCKAIIALNKLSEAGQDDLRTWHYGVSTPQWSDRIGRAWDALFPPPDVKT